MARRLRTARVWAGVMTIHVFGGGLLILAVMYGGG